MLNWLVKQEGFAYESEIESGDEDDEEFVGNGTYSGIIYQMKYLNVSDDSIASVSNKKVKNILIDVDCR